MPSASRPQKTLADRVLPFDVQPLGGAGEFLTVMCPRKDCGQRHSVHGETWRMGRGPAVGTQTRPCPYCFRVARIP